jgi:hypothetical protein
MDLRHELLKDEMQSKRMAMRVADLACFSEDAFRELMDCFLAPDYRLSQRAAYSLGIAARERPELIAPYVNILVEQLRRTDVHDAVLRNSARILEEIDIPENFHGELLDTCFGLVQDRQIPIAVRAYSLTILYKLSKIYPEIRNELRVVIEENMPFEKPAFISRGRKILAKL